MESKKSTSDRTKAHQKSKAVTNTRAKLRESIKNHAFHLGAIDEAAEVHYKHIMKNSPGIGHHHTAIAHLEDLTKIAEQLEQSAKDQMSLAREIKALANEAKNEHKRLC
jgi:hypothetical protein